MPDLDDPSALRALGDGATHLERLDRLSERFGQSLSGAMAAAGTGGRQLTGVLDAVAASLAKTTGTALAGGLRTGLEGAAQSLAASLASASFGGAVTPFAKGGVVAEPSYFPLGSGLGVAGEAGAEAILPLARGPDGRLGIRGDARGPGTVSVTINARDAESFRGSEAQVAAALSRAIARGRRAL